MMMMMVTVTVVPREQLGAWSLELGKVLHEHEVKCEVLATQI